MFAISLLNHISGLTDARHTWTQKRQKPNTEAIHSSRKRTQTDVTQHQHSLGTYSKQLPPPPYLRTNIRPLLGPSRNLHAGHVGWSRLQAFPVNGLNGGIEESSCLSFLVLFYYVCLVWPCFTEHIHCSANTSDKGFS